MNNIIIKTIANVVLAWIIIVLIQAFVRGLGFVPAISRIENIVLAVAEGVGYYIGTKRRQG